MRNKTYITFIINILIGIIFILPVYSFSGNQFDLTISSVNIYSAEIHTDNSLLNKSDSPEITVNETYSAVIPLQNNFNKHHINSDNHRYSKFDFKCNDLHNSHFRNISSACGSNIYIKNISSLNSLRTVIILC
ncbi:MAG: hypothetical protein IPM96_04105 [Ignavibacteria bacterium]|nr:hypothetical protein [Ignavibacteria bacterium]